jgi:hypothetical protein
MWVRSTNPSELLWNKNKWSFDYLKENLMSFL